MPNDNTDSRWSPPKQEPKHLPEDELTAWREARNAAAIYAEEQRMNMSDFARFAGVKTTTFNLWANGGYTGKVHNFTTQVQKALDAAKDAEVVAQRMVEEPDWVETETSGRITTLLKIAQAQPGMVVVNTVPGMGKTKAAEQFCKTVPHAVMATMTPTTSKPTSMLQSLARAAGLGRVAPGDIQHKLGAKLERNGRSTILIVDEAQNLSTDAVNQLRYLLDKHGCGIALLGNEELYSKLGSSKPDPAYAQLHGRVSARMRVMKPTEKDLRTLIDGWDIHDPEMRKLCTYIGKKPGSLRQISVTLKLAWQLANMEQRELTADDIRAAWYTRFEESLA